LGAKKAILLSYSGFSLKAFAVSSAFRRGDGSAPFFSLPCLICLVVVLINASF